MSQIANAAALPSFYALPENNPDAADAARIDMRLTFGWGVALAVATCEPGYHPAPQIHDSEQINYVAEGELWVWVDGTPYHLRAGDAIRVPRMKMHWMWNRSDSRCTFYESHSPAPVGHASILGSNCALFDAGGERLARAPKIVWLAPKYATEAEARSEAPADGPLVVRGHDLATSVHSGAIGAAASGKLTSKCVHGLEHNMTIATRKGSYHSVPHIHDAEQLHYVVRGEIRIFTSDHGFDCRMGDFNIIPRNMPHWAWVPTDDENILLQAHAPVLGSAANRRALLTERERDLLIPTVFNMTPWGVDDIMKVEARHLRALRSTRG